MLYSLLIMCNIGRKNNLSINFKQMVELLEFLILNGNINHLKDIWIETYGEDTIKN
jgi:hypothetical protein